MILTANIGAVRPICDEEAAIRLIAETGFDAIDYSFENIRSPGNPWAGSGFREYAQRLMAVAESCGVCFRQAHAPIAMSPSGQITKEAFENTGFDTMERAFEACSLLKIPHIIVHGVAFPELCTSPQRKLELNIEYYRKLKELAAPYGVRIALENIMKTFANPEDFTAILDALDDDYFIACVDVGHCNLVYPDVGNLIRTLGSRVQALHLHDNHVDYDEHLIPGLGSLDWNEILQALADIRYSGDFTLEISGHALSCMRGDRGFDESFFPVTLKFAEETSRYLMNKLQRMLPSE